jgi:hypothetical protein
MKYILIFVIIMVIFSHKGQLQLEWLETVIINNLAFGGLHMISCEDDGFTSLDSL